MNLSNPTPREPWSLLQRFHDEFNRLYGDAYSDRDDSSVVTSHWVPAVDIKEEAERYVLLADLPGVDPKAIDITMENGVLTIKGQRETEATQGNGYKRVERVRGTFHRRFTLPETADAEGIAAKTENGVLTVTIPKHKKAQPRRIRVG